MRVRRRGAQRRAEVTETAWRWLTGDLLTPEGEPLGPTDPRLRDPSVNPFELMGWAGCPGLVEPYRPATQWEAARHDVVAYWQERGEPMPEAVLRTVRGLATSEELAALEGRAEDNTKPGS